MRRRLFTIFSALSLVLCVAMTVLWVRSYHVSDEFSWQASSGRLYSCSSLAGRLVLGYADGWPYSGMASFQATPLPTGFSTNDLRPSEWSILGFGLSKQMYYRGAIGPARQTLVTDLRVPYGFIVVPSLILPAIHLRSSLRKRRRRKHGLCPKCGYDLRASRERCPECGMPIPAPVASSGGKA